MLQPLITKICFKITYLKFHSNFPGANEKYQSDALLAFYEGIHKWPFISPQRGQQCGKHFHVKVSSWISDAANNLSSPQLVPYTHFYNSTLELLDLMAEYYAWQNPSAHPG